MNKISTISGKLSGWIWNEKEKSLLNVNKNSNISLGAIHIVSVKDSNGAEIFQQPWYLESRGEIDIIVTEKGKMVFVEIERHVLIPPSQYINNWNNFPPSPRSLNPGVRQLELPRGFSSAFMQEAEEEALYKVEYQETIGQVNANTSFFGTSPFIVVYKAINKISSSELRHEEGIKEVKLLSPKEIAELETLCGLSKAALWEFCKWASIKDGVWKEVAKEIIMGWGYMV